MYASTIAECGSAQLRSGAGRFADVTKGADRAGRVGQSPHEARIAVGVAAVDQPDLGMLAGLDSGVDQPGMAVRNATSTSSGARRPGQPWTRRTWSDGKPDTP